MIIFVNRSKNPMALREKGWISWTEIQGPFESELSQCS